MERWSDGWKQSPSEHRLALIDETCIQSLRPTHPRMIKVRSTYLPCLRTENPVHAIRKSGCRWLICSSTEVHVLYCRYISMIRYLIPSLRQHGQPRRIQVQLAAIKHALPKPSSSGPAPSVFPPSGRCVSGLRQRRSRKAKHE